MTANHISKRQKKKWTIHDSRGILTPLERKRLKDKDFHDRHLMFKIKLKTTKALLDDLPLILETFKPIDFLYEEQDGNIFAIPRAQEFLKSLLLYYYELQENAIMEERWKKNRKLKVAFREAWKPVYELIREARKEIQTT